MTIDPAPETAAECVICTTWIGLAPRFQTFIEDVRVSEVCVDCMALGVLLQRQKSRRVTASEVQAAREGAVA